jgi:hypothetical protein
VTSADPSSHDTTHSRIVVALQKKKQICECDHTIVASHRLESSRQRLFAEVAIIELFKSFTSCSESKAAASNANLFGVAAVQFKPNHFPEHPK